MIDYLISKAKYNCIEDIRKDYTDILENIHIDK